MKKRTTVKEDELKELEDLDRLEDLILEHENSIKSDRVKELVDSIENRLKQSPSFCIPIMIDREALHTYLQIQYKDHIKANVLPLIVELGELIHE